MSLIFGSTAAKHWFPDFREPKDLDVISKEPKMSPTLQHYWQNVFSYVIVNNKDFEFVDPNFLYTIKVSHAAWDVKWDKTICDIIFFKAKGCVLDPVLFQLLYKEWEVVHRAKKVKFTNNNKDFFNLRVSRKYDHDWLHQYLAFGDEPMHNKIRLNPLSPICNKDLWIKLSHDDKVKCALEEIYVVATERFISVGFPPRTSKNKSMKALITSMTTGWFNLFLIENFETLLKSNDSHWLNKLKELK